MEAVHSPVRMHDELHFGEDFFQVKVLQESISRVVFDEGLWQDLLPDSV